MIDADTQSVARRWQELESGLVEAHLTKRGVTEAIAVLIPKRNIETWILCLTGSEVDEETDYKGRVDIDKNIRSAAKSLFEWSRPNFQIPVMRVDSLQQAIPELRRIPPPR
jgi:hypothetical protein